MLVVTLLEVQLSMAVGGDFVRDPVRLRCWW